jgi:hypothetical protein
LSLPRKDEPLPLALQFAATAAVAIAHFHIADHQADTTKLRWRAAARFFSPSYRRAAARLKAWQFPLEDMAALLATQTAREAQAPSLAHVAEPTAVSTALVFSHGARLVGRQDLCASMYRLGHSFGSLIYVLDAYEDRARDRRSGDFNPLLALSDSPARAHVLTAAEEVAEQLSTDFALRLRANVEERLGLRPRVLHHRCRKPLQNRWRDAVSFARGLRDREHAGLVKGAAILASVSLLAFLFPHQVRSAESWRHCLGVGMNLMALTAIFATPPPGVPPGVPPGAPPGVPPTGVPPVQPFKPDAVKSGGSSSCCNCGCCCESCDCGECCECGSCCDC